MSGEPGVSAKAKDWHSSKQIRKRARYLLEHPDDEIPSNVTFLVGDGLDEPQKMFRCHKFILAMVSSMFQAMFYGSLPLSENIVKLPDVTPTAFQHMLRYAYGEIIDLDNTCLEGAMDTLYCAKKYLVAKLARACRDHIQFHLLVIKKADPCAAFQRAPQMDEDDLAGLGLTRIAQYTSDVLKGDGFLRLSFDCLKQIVEYAHLRAEEAEIYQGARRWVKHNAGAVSGSAVRDALGSLLYSIRFPLFTATALANGPVTDGVLSAEQAGIIFQFLFADVKPALPFLSTPRTPLRSPLHICFSLLSTPASALVGGFVDNSLVLLTRPDMAPECCTFLRRMINGKLHIQIWSYDNEYSNKPAPFHAAVAEERNVLSYSIPGACWFEWDVEGGAVCNIRIATHKKPHVYRSAVFGFVVGRKGEGLWVPFSLWDDRCIQGVTNFRLA